MEPLSPDARGMGIKSGSNFQLFGGRKRGQSGQGAELRSMGGAPMVVCGLGVMERNDERIGVNN